MTFLQEVYDLGPSYDPAVVDDYSVSVIENGTLATYPVQVPAQYLANLVSPSNQTMLVILTFDISSTTPPRTVTSPCSTMSTWSASIVSDAKDESGVDMTTYVTGGAAISADMEASSTNDMALDRAHHHHHHHRAHGHPVPLRGGAVPALGRGGRGLGHQPGVGVRHRLHRGADRLLHHHHAVRRPHGGRNGLLHLHHDPLPRGADQGRQPGGRRCTPRSPGPASPSSPAGRRS